MAIDLYTIVAPVRIDSQTITISAKRWKTEMPKTPGLYVRAYFLDERFVTEIVRVDDTCMYAPGVMLNADRTKPEVRYAALQEEMV